MLLLHTCSNKFLKYLILLLQLLVGKARYFLNIVSTGDCSPISPMLSFTVNVKINEIPSRLGPFCNVACYAILETILVSNFSIDGSTFWFEFWFFQYFVYLLKLLCVVGSSWTFLPFYPAKGVLNTEMGIKERVWRMKEWSQKFVRKIVWPVLRKYMQI